MIKTIFEWFTALPGQGQATLCASFIAGVFGIVATLVKERFKTLLWITIAVLLIVSLMGVSGWSSRFDFATQTSVAMIVPRGILIESDKDRLFLDAKKEIFFVGATMHITLGNRREAILQKLREGVTIRFLIADPEGSAYRYNAEMFGQTEAELRKETEITLDGFRAVQGEWEKIKPNVPEANRGQCILKTVNAVFPTGFYFYDAISEPLDMLMVPHVMGHDAPEIPSYRIPHEQRKIIEHYYDSFQNMWNSAAVIPPSA